MNQQERAEEHLRTIRRLMERGTIYRAISAPTALVGGLVSIVAGALTYRLIDSIRFLQGGLFLPSFILIWLFVFLLTAGANTLFIVLGARKRNEPVFSASMKAALTALAPPFIIAAILTLFFAATLDLMGEHAVSVTWAICYGLGLLATSHFAPRSLTLLGWAFLASGIAALLAIRFATSALNQHMPTIFMMATFGLLHRIYAVCAWPRAGAAPEP